jgi:predicted nucleic acid-binding protein
VLILLWDASALVKRYSAEIGSDTVDALFSLLPPAQMVTTVLGYTETYAVLKRKRNRGTIDALTFANAISLLQDQVIYDPDFGVLPLEPDAILASISLIESHNLNASDAAILTAYLRYSQSTSLAGSTCILIVADQRFYRAALAEGLPALDPEDLSAADVSAFLAALP